MAFQATMSREHQLWSLHDLSDQVKTRDTEGQKLFQRTIRSMSTEPAEVSDELIQLLERKGYEIVHANTTRIDASMAYQRETQRIKLYEKITSDRCILQGVTTVAGTVENIIGLFKMNSSKVFNETMKNLLPSIVCHAATIATNNDNAHLHWMSFVGLNDQLRLSDLTFASSSQLYEAQEDGSALATLDSNNIYCGTHVWESVDIPSLAEFSTAETKCARQRLTNTGFYVEATEVDDVCRVTFTITLTSMFEASHVSAWMETVIVTALQQLMIQCRTKHLQLIPRSEWSNDKHCQLCAKSFRFNVLRRRHHCRLCGHSICSACSSFITIDTIDTPIPKRAKGSTHVESVRSCLLCAFTEKPPIVDKSKPIRESNMSRPSRVSQAPTTASSFRDSILSKHDSCLSMAASPIESTHRRSLLVIEPSAMSLTAPTSPMIFKSNVTRRQSLQSLPKSIDTPASARYRRRSLHGDPSFGEEGVTMSMHGDLRISERHARRAAMLERSHTFLESAMLTTPGHLNDMELPQQQLTMLRELGVMKPVS